MSQQGPLPFLNFCGIEIANAARTVEYLRNGLGDTMQGHWELGDGALCSVLYRLGSGCTPTAFVSPAADPAPWWNAAEPGAEDFLGFVLLKIDGYDSTLNRGYTNRLNSLGGAVFAQQNRQGRVWKFRAAMISASDAGAEYGLRWLTQTLQTTACDTCGSCQLSVRLVCPPGDCSDEDLGEWMSYEVALVDGPHEVEQRSPGAPADTLAGCRDFVILEWTMVAGNPLLYKPSVPLMDVTIEQSGDCTDICTFLFGDPSDAACATVEPPTLGVLGSIYTLFSLGGFGSVLLEAWSSCPGGSGPVTPELSIQLSELPAGQTVIVDSAKHRITLIDEAGNSSDGSDLVVLATDTSIQWLEVADCDDITCFCVRATDNCSAGTFSALLETQVREG